MGLVLVPEKYNKEVVYTNTVVQPRRIQEGNRRALTEMLQTWEHSISCTD